MNSRKEWYVKDYLKDRRGRICLFLITAFLFWSVSSLNQLENLMPLCYAVLLAAFVWLVFGAVDYIRYVKLRRRLALAMKNREQASLLLQSASGTANRLERTDRMSLAPWDEKISCLEAEFEELVEKLSEDRSQLLSEVEKSRSERNDYYLMWAHQIKTPIAAMKLLLEGSQESFPLREELFKIEQYVEMVLHYLRLESMAGDMILKEYSLEGLVRQTVRKFSVLFINSGLSLKLSDDLSGVSVLTDEKWLCFVLEQLLGNSIKYTKSGSISIYMDGSREKTLVISDTGIGIRPEDIPRIFERGFTGYNGRMDKKSTGIGLYLSKKVLKKLGHDISVESSPGEGTRVYLDLSR